ncbi:caldesmon (CDM) [Fusobacterium pseudoperiodonticum]|uniref:caldesmon (CDM) n=1 Tax=Fusobacterium pseudoperiodonticum TaxID=2663009 RepID=UPI0028F0090E|nr:caldesmon (CDM) [Fusobacterium pseudoperiodonticum]
MKKKLFGLFLFSLILSSLAYAKIRDTGNEEAAQNVAETSIVKLSPEEEKEAFKALERARKRIEKEDKEREEALKLAEKQAQEEAKRIEEAQAKAQAEAEEQQKQVQQVQETVVVQENGNTVTEVVTTASGLTPKEEKEAFKALERARKRIEKEDKERAEALKLAEEQARAQAAQSSQE